MPLNLRPLIPPDVGSRYCGWTRFSSLAMPGTAHLQVGQPVFIYADAENVDSYYLVCGAKFLHVANPRRSIVALLSLAMLFSPLFAAGSQAKSSKKVNLTVFGAASLIDVLPKLSNAFRVKNPDIKFTFSFAGSSTLAQQIIAGAPADLFFSAGPAPMESVRIASGLNGLPRNFASNSLVMVVPKGNPAAISALTDLTKPGVKFVLCAPQVPCGSASAKVLALAKIDAQPVSLENDVKSVLTKVALGEADAGLVYRTDRSSGVTVIEFPESREAINKYPVALVSGSKKNVAARAFINFVLSKAGQAILAKAGFGRP